MSPVKNGLTVFGASDTGILPFTNPYWQVKLVETTFGNADHFG